MYISEVRKLLFLGFILILGVAAMPATSFAAAGSKAATMGLTLVGDDDDDDRRRSRRGNRRGGSLWEPQSDRKRGSRREKRDDDRESRREQWESDRRSRRQQWESDRRSRRQQWESDRRSRRQEWGSDRRSNERDRDNYRNNRGYGRNVYYGPQPWTQWFPNRGQQVRAERHWRNEQRRYWKNERKAQRRFEREQRRRYRNSSYNDNYNYFPSQTYDYYAPDRSSLKEEFIRNLIGGLLGGGQLGGFKQLIQDRGYGYLEPRRVYSPNYINNQNYVLAQPQYYSDHGYNSGLGSGAVGLIGALPIAEMIEHFAGDNEFVSAIAGNLLNQGYDQGYYAGQYARDNGYRNAVYNDPYTDRNGNCYMLSSAIGDNRALLSQGYELGYRDAMLGNNDYNDQRAGNGDLISTLLSGVLSGV